MKLFLRLLNVLAGIVPFFLAFIISSIWEGAKTGWKEAK